MKQQTNNFGKIADKPFNHTGRYGTKLIATRCDFKDGVIIEKPDDISIEHYTADIAEIFTFHSVLIWPDLNGFNGYSCVKITIQKPDENQIQLEEDEFDRNQREFDADQFKRKQEMIEKAIANGQNDLAKKLLNSEI